MTVSQQLAQALVIAALLLVPSRGLLCPFTEPGDDSPYFSLCAMCSHNEAAVRWNRSSESNIEWRRFNLSYHCSGSSVNITSENPFYSEGWAVDNDCPWDKNNLNSPPSGISSVGVELTTGTSCTFTLDYNVKIDGRNGRNGLSSAACTVESTCERNVTTECSIDQVCTFGNTTHGGQRMCSSCSCAEGYSGSGCDNVDECESGNVCGEYSDCHDTDGSYLCECLPGFQRDGYNCTDVDECLTQNETCYDENAHCVNTEGNFTCQCNSGFTGDGYNCSDIDECGSGNVCGEYAGCHDTDGSYRCECLPGFQGDGYNCTDVDECLTQNETCYDENAHCVNTEGNFTCQCNSGFTGDGYNCSDVNECRGDEHKDCHMYANCINTDGNYTCECQDGFTGDGWKHCQEVENSYAGPATITIAIAVGITGTIVLVIALTVIILLLKMSRSDQDIFDSLYVKELDPFYTPKFLGGSVKSLHSEYESLHVSKPTYSTNDIDCVSNHQETVETDATSVSSITDNPTQLSEVEQKNNHSLEDDSTEQKVSGYVSDDKIPSAPYISEGSVLKEGHGNSQSHKTGASDLAKGSDTVSISSAGTHKSCSTELSSLFFSSTSDQGPHSAATMGYVDTENSAHHFKSQLIIDGEPQNGDTLDFIVLNTEDCSQTAIVASSHSHSGYIEAD